MLDENYIPALRDFSKNFFMEPNIKSFNVTRIKIFYNNHKDSSEFLKTEFGELKDLNGFIDYTHKTTGIRYRKIGITTK